GSAREYAQLAAAVDFPAGEHASRKNEGRTSAFDKRAAGSAPGIDEKHTAVVDGAADVSPAGEDTFLPAAVDDGVAGEAARQSETEPKPPDASTVNCRRNGKPATGDHKKAAVRYNCSGD